MEIYYHGSSVLFKAFDLSYALEGDGKCKFGYGVYITHKYATAAHYSGCGKGETADEHYVYTVEVPDMTDDNHLWSNKPVHQDIIKRTEQKLGESIPTKVCAAGKLFRKYVGNKVLGKKGTVNQLSSTADFETEKAATNFLLSIGVDMLVWPYCQRKPDGEQYRAILDESKVKIIKVEQVELKKGKLIKGSEKEILLWKSDYGYD